MLHTAEMTIDQLIRHFGSQSEAARALKVSRQSVNLWKRHGIPVSRQLQIESITDGAIKASAAARQIAARYAMYAREHAA